MYTVELTTEILLPQFFLLPLKWFSLDKMKIENAASLIHKYKLSWRIQNNDHMLEISSVYAKPSISSFSFSLEQFRGHIHVREITLEHYIIMYSFDSSSKLVMLSVCNISNET